MLTPRLGDGHPEVISPKMSPSLERICAPCRAGGPEEATRPTLFTFELKEENGKSCTAESCKVYPALICWRIVGAPGKLASILRRLDTNHVREPSMGVVFESISLPYRHKPASSLENLIRRDQNRKTSSWGLTWENLWLPILQVWRQSFLKGFGRLFPHFLMEWTVQSHLPPCSRILSKTTKLMYFFIFISKFSEEMRPKFSDL